MLCPGDVIEKREKSGVINKYSGEQIGGAIIKIKTLSLIDRVFNLDTGATTMIWGNTESDVLPFHLSIFLPLGMHTHLSRIGIKVTKASIWACVLLKAYIQVGRRGNYYRV